MLALGLERHKLHLRIALNIIRLTGTKANGIIAGFMLATALLSMWISNTATTVMMLPIAASVIRLLGLEDKENTTGEKRFALGLMLGIAYSANIGGMATLIGTPPNVVLAGTVKSLYNYQIMFGDWLMIGLPASALMWGATYLFIVKIIYPNRLGNFEAGRELIRSRLAELGPVRTDEKRMIAVFAGTALLWIFGSYIGKIFPRNRSVRHCDRYFGELAFVQRPLCRKAGHCTFGMGRYQTPAMGNFTAFWRRNEPGRCFFPPRFD